jgi:hypothetical protein
MIKKLIRLFIVINMVLVFLIPIPVHAIANPTSIDFGRYQVFYDVLETGDWLIAAEGQVLYAVYPTDYTADEAFLFEMLNAAGTSTLASTTLQSYGDRPIGIYLTAAQVTTLALTTGTAYQLRITGNPSIFASQTGNTITITLTAGDYTDQNLGVDNGVPTENDLRNFMIVMAEDIYTYDYGIDPTIQPIWVSVQGYNYLTLTGANIFIEGIPSLDVMCPILFKSGIKPMADDKPETTGAYASTLTPGQKWGATVANGLTQLGTYLGIGQALAGSVMLFVLVIMLAAFIYSKTESGISVLLMVAACPFLGAYLGLMPMALAFIFVVVIIVLLGYFFLSRRAL